MIDELVAILEPAAKKAFARIAHEHARESFYCVALYTSPDYRYVVDTSSTLEGLERVAQEYLRKPPYRRRWRNLETAMFELKWSPCDSPYHACMAHDFQDADRVLEEIWRHVADDVSYERTATAIQNAFERVTRSIRAAAIFNDAVLYNVLMGDQSDEERIAIAWRLNPSEVVERFRTESEAAGNL